MPDNFCRNTDCFGRDSRFRKTGGYCIHTWYTFPPQHIYDHCRWSGKRSGRICENQHLDPGAESEKSWHAGDWWRWFFHGNTDPDCFWDAGGRNPHVRLYGMRCDHTRKPRIWLPLQGTCKYVEQCGGVRRWSSGNGCLQCGLGIHGGSRLKWGTTADQRRIWWVRGQWLCCIGKRGYRHSCRRRFW